MCKEKPQKNDEGVIYTNLSPFEASLTDMETKQIYIDRKFAWSGDALKYLLFHERLHQASDQFIDPEVEFMIPSMKVHKDLLKRKPLMILNPFMPVVFWKDENNKTQYRIEMYRVGFVVLFIIIFTVISSFL